MRYVPTIIAIMLVAASATAANFQVSGSEEKKGCKIFRICDAETAAAVCGNATPRFARLEGMQIHTAMVSYVQTGGADGWTITLYNVAQGAEYSATQRTQINPTAMSVANGLTFSWAGPMGDLHAVRANAGDDTVTVDIKSCPASN